MGAHVIDGRGLAAELKEELVTVLVGSPAEAEAYERRVRKLAGEFGYRYACERLPAGTEKAEVNATVGKLKEGDVVGTGTISIDGSARRERIVR
jgi:5,10-methylene-tetrahydrofolate dehydrogenase/methenyl tetrahydrofolate cyclohydrolase